MAEINYESTPIIDSVENKKYMFTPYDESTVLGGKVFESSNLKIMVRGSSDRYDFSKPLNLRIQYLTRGDYDSETGKYTYEDSNYQNITINPYSNDDTVNYKTEEVRLSGSCVKSIEIVGSVSELKIYKEATTVTSDNFKKYAQESGFIIPIVDELPDPSTVTNGSVYILRKLM